MGGPPVPPPVRDLATGCLLYQGKLQPNGYPHGAHRRSYEEHVGPIPEGYTIDHVWARGCRYKHCLEPAHLEAVTLAENLRRRSGASETHCGKNHEFTPENTLWKKNGTRQCKRCQAQYRKKYREQHHR